VENDQLKFYEDTQDLKKRVEKLNGELLALVEKHLPTDRSINFQASILASIMLTFHGSIATVLERIGATSFIQLTPELIRKTDEVMDLERQFNSEERKDSDLGI
jgi:hypothetical protein